MRLFSFMVWALQIALRLNPVSNRMECHRIVRLKREKPDEGTSRSRTFGGWARPSADLRRGRAQARSGVRASTTDATRGVRVRT